MGKIDKKNKHNVRFTETIEFIRRKEVPADRDITYAFFLLDYGPLKEKKYRVRIVVGGDKLSYTFDVGSLATDLLETKILINSTISDAQHVARFATAVIKDFSWHHQWEGRKT